MVHWMLLRRKHIPPCTVFPTVFPTVALRLRLGRMGRLRLQPIQDCTSYSPFHNRVHSANYLILNTCLCVQAALWCQKAVRDEENVVVWDYHIFLLLRPSNNGGLGRVPDASVVPESWVYDYDTTLDLPCPAQGEHHPSHAVAASQGRQLTRSESRVYIAYVPHGLVRPAERCPP